MTTREQLAGMAMQGLLANTIYHNPNEKHKMIQVDALVETAVTYADALLKQLDAKERHLAEIEKTIDAHFK